MAVPAYDGQPTFRPVRVVDESPRFAQLWDSVLFDPELSSNAKVIYAVLQRMAYEAHGADLAPSMKRIAERANIKDRETVATCLRQLEERGHIKRVPRTKWEADVLVLTPPATPHAEKTRNEHADKTRIDAEETRTDHAGNIRTSHAEKTRNLIEINELDIDEEIDTPPLPPKSDEPFDLWESFCAAMGQDYRQATSRAQGIALREAKALIDDDISAADVTGCVAYMQSQTWRTGIITFKQMAGVIGDWRMAGKREHDPPPRSNKPVRPTYSDAGRVLEQFKEQQRNGSANGEDAGVRGTRKPWGPWGYLEDDSPALLDQVEAGPGPRDPGHGVDGGDLELGAGGIVEARYRVGSS